MRSHAVRITGARSSDRWVEHGLKSPGACARKANEHGFSARGAQWIMARRPDGFGAEPVGDHQALIFRQDTLGKVGSDGECKEIAIVQIVSPFVIGLEVGEPGLDLDNGEPAPMIQRHDIGAPAIGERQLEENGLVGGHQRPPDAAPNARRNLRADLEKRISVRCHSRSTLPWTRPGAGKRS